jgi:MoxR-like ATPase
VQSALLEVMQEHQVTIGHETFKVPEPFLVMATQNPIESEGTYPLPEAQVDRFMMKVVVDYPTPAEEMSVVHRSLTPAAAVQQVLPIDKLLRYQEIAANVYVDRAVAEYSIALVNATRRPASVGLAQHGAHIAFGSSPRGSINLVHAGRALALLRGRRYVLPQDVQELTKDVLRHRMVLTYQALAEEITSDHILDNIMQRIPMPRIDLAHEMTA